MFHIHVSCLLLISQCNLILAKSPSFPFGVVADIEVWILSDSYRKSKCCNFVQSSVKNGVYENVLYLGKYHLRTVFENGLYIKPIQFRIPATISH